MKMTSNYDCTLLINYQNKDAYLAPSQHQKELVVELYIIHTITSKDALNDCNFK